MLSFPLDAFDDDPLATGMPLFSASVHLSDGRRAHAPASPGTTHPCTAAPSRWLALLVVHGVRTSLALPRRAADETRCKRENARCCGASQGCAVSFAATLSTTVSDDRPIGLILLVLRSSRSPNRDQPHDRCQAQTLPSRS